jgi:L-histidine Nalpha-methyltransferase
LEPAYNDSQGVTAAFNLNILAHLNWRFGGDFVLERFAHQAVYNQELRRIEMYLRSLENQAVNLQALDLQLELAINEKILTEISCKFDWEQMDQRFATWGLEVVDRWTDQNQWFGLFLGTKSPGN